MVATRKSDESPRRRRPAATTPEGRENQLINMAVEYAEKQFREGTASSQVTVHFLKLGATRNRLETMKLEREVALLSARTDSISSNERIEELYKDAINAMRAYNGDEEGSHDEPY